MVDIATIEEVRGWVIDNTDDASMDAILEPLRLSVDASIKAYCDCLFGMTEAIVGEIHDGRRGDLISPVHFPVVSVQKIVLGAYSDGTGGYELQSDEYFVREEEIVLAYAKATQRRGSIRLDYTHGYPEMPAQIKQALLLGVEAMYNRKTRRSIGITSRSKGGESESYGSGSGKAWDAATGLPAEVMGMLQNFRSIEFTGSSMAIRNS